MKPKTVVLMLLAVGGGLVASFMTSRYLAGQQQQPQAEHEEEGKVTILVAKQAIPGYTALREPKLFEEKEVTKSQVEILPGTVDKFEKIKNRTLKNSLAAGKPVTEGDLLPPNTEALEHKLKPGERAITVKVTPDSAVAGFILPGSMVDVIATQSNRMDQQEPYSKVVLQNVEVLAIDSSLQTPDGTVSKTADRVTLRLTLNQCEELEVQARTGTLCLVLRKGNDNSIIETGGATAHGSKKKPAEQGGLPWFTDPTPGKPITGPVVPPDGKPAETKNTSYTLTIMNGSRIEKHQVDLEP